MSASQPARKKTRSKPAKDRRAAPGSKGVLRTLRCITSAMSRPLGLTRRDGKLQLVFIERRKQPMAVDVPAVEQQSLMDRLRADIRARVLEYAPDDAELVMHHLMLVHDEMGRKGWAGVEAMATPVLGQALLQAQLLVRRQPSPALDTLVERLRPLLLAADGRVQRDARQRDVVSVTQLEISEASREEFDESERSWFGSLPQPLAVPPEESTKK
jgi:hypothetical protein